MFSPYYAWARNRGGGDPLDHVALNVALYGAGGHRWSLTERGRKALQRSADTLVIGPSQLAWRDGTLVIDIDEVGVPVPRRLRGRIRVKAPAIVEQDFALDVAGKHRWRPIAPGARIEVDMETPGLSWAGQAYVDSNGGEGPLERTFAGWHWSRARNADGGTTVFYDVERYGAEPLSLSLRIDPHGRVAAIEAPPEARLPGTRWRIGRSTRCDADVAPQVISTLEDTPFYARSLVQSQLQGAPLRMVHESLSLQRFATPWVKWMLPFRMPRRAG